MAVGERVAVGEGEGEGVAVGVGEVSTGSVEPLVQPPSYVIEFVKCIPLNPACS